MILCGILDVCRRCVRGDWRLQVMARAYRLSGLLAAVRTRRAIHRARKIWLVIRARRSK
jgi:hypothetical protein